MSRRNKIFGVGLLFAAMTASTAARAQQPPPAEYPACPKIGEGSEEMKRRFNAARTDYEDGSYDSALKRFREVYAVDCKPELLLFIAATWEKKRDLWQTLYALELFVQRAPKDSSEITPTQNRIARLKEEIARQPQQQPPPRTNDPPPPPRTPPPTAAQSDHTIYPWIVVGVGAAVVVTGIVLVATAALPEGCTTDGDSTCAELSTDKEDPGYRRIPPSTPEGKEEIINPRLVVRREDAGAARGREIGGIIALAGGAALVAGGVIWHFLEPTGQKSARLSPAIGPGFAGVGLSGRF